MGTRFLLSALLALTLGCESASSEEIGLEREFDAGTDVDAGTGTDAGSDTDAGTDADADADAGTDAGTDTDTDAGTDAGTDSDAGTGGSGGDPAPCSAGPLSAPLPSCTPSPVPDTGDIHADCVARINQFRWDCQCLPPLARWVAGESCTDSNAEYDSSNGVHASFFDIPCGSGSRAQNECPNWPSNAHVIDGCLQAMWDEGPEDGNPDTVNGHYESMATSTYTQVACGFFTTPSGKVWGVQNFD